MRLLNNKWATLAGALAMTLALAACGGSSPPQATGPDPALGAAKTAATEAAMKAKTAFDAAKEAAADANSAYEAAKAAVMAQDANEDANKASYAVAANARDRAKMAAMDAQAAANAAMDAYTAAKAAMDAATDATTVAAAEEQRDIARSRQLAAEAKMTEAANLLSDAEDEQANAEKYAGMVQTAQNALDAEAQRVQDVAAAVSRAETSYMEADADATKANAQAEEAEATAPGSPGAMAARAAATAAREAATAAEAAHDAIMDDMTKAEADAEAGKAAKQAMYANNGYMTAKAENNTIQTAAIVGEEQLEARDLAQAKADAEELYNDADDGVTFHYNAVVGKASDAAAQARAARMAANQAKYARTDATTANTHATAAETASGEAQAALARAMTAKQAADTARQAVMDATTSADAKAALADLETANDDLTAEHTGAMGAGMAYMRAKGAAGRAADAQGVHVISLLIHANAQDIVDVDSDVVTGPALQKAIDTRLKMVATVINEAGAEDNNIGDGTPIATDTANPTTVMATWGADTPDSAATPEDETMTRMLSIAVNPTDGGDALAFKTTAKAEEDDPTTDINDTLPKTASKFDRGLGIFDGYEIEDDVHHVIVFTDKKQNVPTRAAVTAIAASEHTNLTVELTGHTITDLGSKSGTTYTGVTFYETGTVDDSTDEDLAFMGSLTCPDGMTCNIQTDADGEVTAISGYQFSGSRAARATVAGLTEAENPANSDYLAFGVWLREAVTGDSPTGAAFAAFAGGGQMISTNAGTELPNSLTGAATYNGKATGVYTEGSGVDYFEGDATLTADFGAIDTDEERGSDPAADTTPGVISGSIHGIYVGGVSSSDTIRLSETAIANGAFSGNARLGRGVIQDDDTVKYPYNGSWSGNFYGGNPDDTETNDVNELAAPDSVAGTFGVSGKMGEGDDAITRSYVGAFGAHR